MPETIEYDIGTITIQPAELRLAFCTTYPLLAGLTFYAGDFMLMLLEMLQCMCLSYKFVWEASVPCHPT